MVSELLVSSFMFHCFVRRRKADGGHWGAAVTTGQDKSHELRLNTRAGYFDVSGSGSREVLEKV